MVINLYPFQKVRGQFFRKPYALAAEGMMASAAHIKNETDYDPRHDIHLMYGPDPYMMKGMHTNVSNYIKSLDNPETLTNSAYPATTTPHVKSGTSPFDWLNQDQPVRPVSADPIRTYDARRARALAAFAPPTTCLPGFTAQIRGTPPNVTVSCVPAPKGGGGGGTIPTNPITDPFSTHQPSTNTSSVAAKPSSSSSSSSSSTPTLNPPSGGFSFNFSQIMNWLKANPTADFAIAAVVIVLILVGVRVL